MNIDDMHDAWIDFLVAGGATPEQAEVWWVYEKARAEYDEYERYREAQDAYSLMEAQDEVPH